MWKYVKKNTGCDKIDPVQKDHKHVMNYLIKTMKTFLNPILKVKTFYIKTLCSFFLRRRDKNCERRKKERERGGKKDEKDREGEGER